MSVCALVLGCEGKGHLRKQKRTLLGKHKQTITHTHSIMHVLQREFKCATFFIGYFCFSPSLQCQDILWERCIAYLIFTPDHLSRKQHANRSLRLFKWQQLNIKWISRWELYSCVINLKKSSRTWCICYKNTCKKWIWIWWPDNYLFILKHSQTDLDYKVYL